MKDSRIDIRIDEKLKTALLDFCRREQISFTKFIIETIKHYFSCKKKKTIIFNVIKNLEIKENIRKQNHQFYLIKNCFHTIITMNKVCLLMTGKPDLELTGQLIKNYQEMYDSFPPKIRKLLSKQWHMVTKLSNKDNLMMYLNAWIDIKDFLEFKPPKQLR